MVDSSTAAALAAISGTLMLGTCAVNFSGSVADPNGTVTVVTGSSTPTPTPTPSATATSSDSTDLTALKIKLKSHLGDIPPSTIDPPPSVTFSSGSYSLVPRISGGKFISWTDPTINYVGIEKQSSTNFPDAAMGRGFSVNYGSQGQSANRQLIDFTTDAPAFEILLKGDGAYTSSHRILIDGKYVSKDYASYPADGSLYWTRVDFGSIRSSHKIQIEGANFAFGGVAVGGTDTVAATSKSNVVHAIVLGDSFTEPYNSYAAELGRQLGWEDVSLSGVGCTGYLEICGNRLKFHDRMATDVYSLKPEVLIIAGGINDTAFSVEQIDAEVRSLYSEISQNLPNTIVFVLSPWNPHNCCTKFEPTIRNAATARKNFYYIDTTGWLLGSGNTSNPKGDGVADQYISSDNTHPSAAGHQYIAERLASVIKGIITGF